jgi:hypothetical protein
VTVLNDACKQTKAEQDGEALQGLAAVEGATDALLKCGPDAKEPLSKDALPRLKDLQFHKSAKVREVADKLRKKIEEAR